MHKACDLRDQVALRPYDAMNGLTGRAAYCTNRERLRYGLWPAVEALGTVLRNTLSALESSQRHN